MGIDWEDILGDNVDIQDAYEDLVYDSDQYSSGYGQSYAEEDYESEEEREKDKAELAKAREHYAEMYEKEVLNLPF